MKLNITIDVTKIPKDRIVERRYTNTQGHEIIAKDLKLDVVPLREPIKIKDGDTWEMWKTHFISLPQTQEERVNKVKSLIIGSGMSFQDKKVEAEDVSQDIPYPEEELSADSIPF